MQIWVDADACPVVIKEILFKAAERTQTQTTLVANHFMRTPPSKVISFLRVTAGFDVADDEIVKQVSAGDLVITSDIPLAAEVIEKQALALSPRGELFSEANIKQKLNMRDFMDTMRASGEQTQGPPPLGQSDRQAFANHLDTLLRRHGGQ
ncbi:YaiI/YqxD family protein [Thalassomonas haliotis]|uniref:UPF0178 protein H3N35_20010 n=1 Tax=Thalassomonas haliotis TaxID=485448 RepID=A0ABY7VAC7_9GAMM|nr:YaiI/YqxD family protein [Thalassomonas haliotis]WDE10528.1 YaiI/YqxD family protein [Thalassomonas haliotis]